MDAPCVYVRASTLCFFHSLISTKTTSVNRCAEIKSAPTFNGGVTNSGRVWRKVPESDARSVADCMSVTVI